MDQTLEIKMNSPAVRLFSAYNWSQHSTQRCHVGKIVKFVGKRKEYVASM